MLSSWRGFVKEDVWQCPRAALLISVPNLAAAAAAIAAAAAAAAALLKAVEDDEEEEEPDEDLPWVHASLVVSVLLLTVPMWLTIMPPVLVLQQRG